MPGSWRSSGGRTGAGRQAAPGAAGGAVAGAAGRAVLPHKDHDPRGYGFVEHRWTRDLVADRVEEVFGVRFTPQWTGTLLCRLGLLPQCPAYRASEADAAAGAAWRQQTYPAIRAEAAQAGATVYFGDELGVAASHHAGTTWAPAGRTAVVSHRVTVAGEHGLRHRAARPAALPGGRGSFTAACFVGFCRM